jgi:hypothetical protein
MFTDKSNGKKNAKEKKLPFEEKAKEWLSGLWALGSGLWAIIPDYGRVCKSKRRKNVPIASIFFHRLAPSLPTLSDCYS